jgi:hypothetical protein
LARLPVTGFRFLAFEATMLLVETTARTGAGGSLVGVVDAKRTISLGPLVGIFAIGAWETIFASVAEDVTKEVARHISRE